MTAEPTAMTLDLLLDFVKRTRGFDFTGYKRSTLERRVAQAHGGASASRATTDYVDHLEVHPEEFDALFNTILINVTAFFRDAPTWDTWRDEVVPQLLAARRAGRADPRVERRLRVGRGGLHGRHAARRGARARRRSGTRVKIYATDVDEEALDDARRGDVRRRRRSRRAARELLERYFEPLGRPLHVPPGPAPRGDLRPQRPRAGRADLAHRPAASAATR